MRHFSSRKPVAALATLTLLTLAACQKERFHVEGHIDQAQDSTLYFEHLSLDGPVKLDSVRLTREGTFSFAAERGETPEFYRLRIAGQIINLSADSTETITVSAQYPTMATDYEVNGSDNCRKIRELALMQINLQAQAQRVARDPSLGQAAVRDSVLSLIDSYKQLVQRQYIFSQPMKAYSYFALFQYIYVDGAYINIFDPRRDKADNKVFGAVATNWDALYPGSIRGQNLHNITIEGMKNQRIVDRQNAMVINADSIDATNVIDISLVDNHGQPRRLTDLKGRVVMLDFHVFAHEQSMERIMMLRELWNKYHDRGFDIFQVSLDPDAHFWKTKTEALPWVCVRDDESLSSPYLVKFNVQTIPTFFLVQRDGQLYKRDAQMENVEQEIQKLLAR